MKSAMVNIRVPDNVREILKKAAADANESVSQFLLKGALLRLQTGQEPEIPKDPFVVAWERALTVKPVEKLSPENKAFIAEVEAKQKQGNAKPISLEDGLRALEKKLTR
ncbi:MAG TPA: hypothetical protein VK914_02525 [bacterium]|jgi:hypothetical protein|nr:hypothetical protein [bacterium]